jgi:hypothetical protein
VIVQPKFFTGTVRVAQKCLHYVTWRTIPERVEGV